MKKQWKHYSPEEKVAILRRHLLDKEPISKLCDDLGLQPTVFLLIAMAAVPARTVDLSVCDPGWVQDLV